MKEKLLLVGAGGFGRIVLEHASREFFCSFVDDGIETGSVVNGCSVVGKISDIKNLFGEYTNLIVTIGNNRLREYIYKTSEEVGYRFPNIIDSSAYISPYAKYGTGCVFLNNVVVQNNAKIGNGVILNSGVEIHNDCVIGNNVLIYANTVIRTMAKIGNRSLIGSTLTISNDVILPDDSKIEDGEDIRK